MRKDSTLRYYKIIIDLMSDFLTVNNFFSSVSIEFQQMKRLLIIGLIISQQGLRGEITMWQLSIVVFA